MSAVGAAQDSSPSPHVRTLDVRRSAFLFHVQVHSGMDHTYPGLHLRVHCQRCPCPRRVPSVLSTRGTVSAPTPVFNTLCCNEHEWLPLCSASSDSKCSADGVQLEMPAWSFSCHFAKQSCSGEITASRVRLSQQRTVDIACTHVES
mmetsp:Transcript_3551/g.6222  ORF Transcript_3551/g.6222 Transcript_3551/m.6222 type:complete len:147 (-) Transcript_3551:35-475(-)